MVDHARHIVGNVPADLGTIQSRVVGAVAFATGPKRGGRQMALSFGQQGLSLVVAVGTAGHGLSPSIRTAIGRDVTVVLNGSSSLASHALARTRRIETSRPKPRLAASPTR